MAQNQFQTLRMTDAAMEQALRLIWDELGRPANSRLSFWAFDSLQAAEAAVESELPAIVARVLGLETTAFAKIQLAMPSLLNAYVAVMRGEGRDVVQYYMVDQAPPERTVPFAAAIRTAFRQVDPVGHIDRILGPELAEFYQRREQGLLRLEETAQRVITREAEYRTTLDAEFAAQRERLRAEIETQRSEMQRELSARTADLEARERALVAERESLDDRRATHARRKLREDLLAAIRKSTGNFQLSEATAKKRIPTHVAFAVLALALLVAAGVSLWKSEADAASWVALARFVASALSFVGVMIFYVRWQDRWSQAHADEEFNQRRLELDVDRASWVVEVGLEWKEEKGGATMPPDLLDRLTRNLFRASAERDAVRHPTQDLGSALLRAASRVKVTPSGIEAELNPRDLSRFAAAADDARGRS